MFAKCEYPNGELKLCPFLVTQKEFPKSISSNKITTQQFKECLGYKCAAYDDGHCLRLRRD